MSHRIDDYATRGLLGTADSLAYRVAELERHMHNWERWMCKAAAGTESATHLADRIGATADSKVAFTLTSGIDTWGAWVQILGSADTPVVAGMAKWDLHRILITTTNQVAIWFMQLAFGASGADALTANTFCSFVYNPAGPTDKTAPIDVLTRRQANGTLAWARAWSVGANAKTISFMFGLHEYEG